jgi:hypothetical protein
MRHPKPSRVLKENDREQLMTKQEIEALGQSVLAQREMEK